MDIFNFLIAILLIIIAMQFGQNWMVFGVVAIMLLSAPSIMMAVLLIGSTIVLLMIGPQNLSAHLPIIVIGLIVAALVMGIKGQPQQPEMYSPEGFGDLLGGGGGV